MPTRPAAKLRVVTTSADAKPELDFAFEPLFVTAGEFPALFRALSKEVGPDPRKCPFDLDWDTALAQNLNKQLHVLTARNADHELCGFVFILIGPPTKYRKTLHAQFDMLWLKPEYRKGRLGVRMLEECERYCRELGVKRILVAAPRRYKNKRGRRLDSLFLYMRYKPLEVVWHKYL